MCESTLDWTSSGGVLGQEQATNRKRPRAKPRCPNTLLIISFPSHEGKKARSRIGGSHARARTHCFFVLFRVSFVVVYSLPQVAPPSLFSVFFSEMLLALFYVLVFGHFPLPCSLHCCCGGVFAFWTSILRFSTSKHRTGGFFFREIWFGVDNSIRIRISIFSFFLASYFFALRSSIAPSLMTRIRDIENKLSFAILLRISKCFCFWLLVQLFPDFLSSFIPLTNIHFLTVPPGPSRPTSASLDSHRKLDLKEIDEISFFAGWTTLIGRFLAGFCSPSSARFLHIIFLLPFCPLLCL